MFVKVDQVIGLESGPVAEAIIDEMGKLSYDLKETLSCIRPTLVMKTKL